MLATVAGLKPCSTSLPFPLRRSGMSGGSRRPAARSRPRPPTVADSAAAVHHDKPLRRPRSDRQQVHGPIRLINAPLRTLLVLVLGSLIFLLAAFAIYSHTTHSEDEAVRRMMPVVTPFPAPKMMDLPQFQGEHKENLYCGTYRPHVYLGIRARTPRSLIAGLMWLGVKDGQYHLRHVCQDAHDLATYGWTDHDVRNYGRQVTVDHGLSLTTSFLKEKGTGSGYGGDWALRVDAQNDKSMLEETGGSTAHIFFYIADEEGHSLGIGREDHRFRDDSLLAFGSRNDVGSWEVHLKPAEIFKLHYSGIRTSHMHNITELVQGILAVNARSSGRIELPDVSEDSSNLIVFQISMKLPSKMDISFLSGTDSKSSMVKDRIDNLSGIILTSRLNQRQNAFEEKYISRFNLNDKVDMGAINAGRAAIGNLLGGIGYFYGQSKIALPKGFSQENGDKFVSYWPAALYTAVPSRSFFPRGFLWDEGFHQLVIWRWDINICLDIIGHWLDLINVNGWIPREQILGAEALSKVPDEFVLQHSTNGNPPTLFLALRDMVSYTKAGKLSISETNDISTFLSQAYVRLGAWFQWFNTTQSGKNANIFYWHGRDHTAVKELNPKTLSSGLDDYPRASHPSNEERHLDLRCWMLLAADCMQSIAEHLSIDDSLKKDYYMMVQRLANFELLNQMHLDDTSGSYFDFGNHTEKVRLRRHDVRDGDIVKRELVRETLETPHLALVPHVGYVGLFPFMMGIIPPASWILAKQLELMSNSSILWTDYGLRSLSKTSSLYMKRNTEHDPPYWRGPIWVNINYMILSALHHYSQEDGPYRAQAETLYKELRTNLIKNIVQNFHESGFLWEQYDQKNKGKGKGAHPFTGWTSLVLLMMAEAYPSLQISSSLNSL